MSEASTTMTASPEAIFEVLADPTTYGHWVVGSQRIRWSESSWPEPGSRFGHQVGLGPLRLQDTTHVLECVPQRRLVLRTKAWPLGETVVELRLRPLADGTEVVMRQTPTRGLLRAMNNRVFERLNAWRDRECLRRIEQLA